MCTMESLGMDGPRWNTKTGFFVTIMKVLDPLFNKRNHVTCDNFFASVSLTRKLLAKECTLVGIMRTNRHELPPNILQILSSFAWVFVYGERWWNITDVLPVYDIKICSLDFWEVSKDVQVFFYNHNKVTIDVVTWTACRRRSLHGFLNVIDIALSNSWII